MQRHRYHEVESTPAQPFIVQRSAEPTRYEMAQVNLAPIFKFVNDLANDAATAICGHGCVEVNHAMRTVGTCKCACDGTLEGFGTFLAKWCDDTGGLCFALIAEILARSNASSADCANRRI